MVEMEKLFIWKSFSEYSICLINCSSVVHLWYCVSFFIRVYTHTIKSHSRKKSSHPVLTTEQDYAILCSLCNPNLQHAMNKEQAHLTKMLPAHAPQITESCFPYQTRTKQTLQSYVCLLRRKLTEFNGTYCLVNGYMIAAYGFQDIL